MKVKQLGLSTVGLQRSDNSILVFNTWVFLSFLLMKSGLKLKSLVTTLAMTSH